MQHGTQEAAATRRHSSVLCVMAHGLRAIIAVLVASGLGPTVWASAAAKKNASAFRDQRTVAALKELAEGYLKNRESFPFFSCTFMVADGRAKSVKEGMLHGPTSDIARAEGVWIVSGEKVRYESRIIGNVEIKKTGDGFTARFPPIWYLAKGPLSVKIDQVLGGGGISSERAPSSGITMTPWDMGGLWADRSSNPGDLIATFLDKYENVRFTYHGAIPHEGEIFESFDVDFGNGSREVHVLDPKRGYLPVEVTYFNKQGRVDTKAFITDIQRCSGDRWFPTRCVWITILGPDDLGNCTVRDLRVTSLDAEHPPPESAFVTEIPFSFWLHDCIHPLSTIRVPAGTKLHVDELESLLETAQRKAAQREAEREAAGPEEGSRTVRWAMLAANVLIVLCLIGVMLFRRVRARRAETP